MAPQSTFMYALRQEAGKAKLHVRATRVWETIHTKKLVNTKVVFVDDEVRYNPFIQTYITFTLRENQVVFAIWNNQKEDHFPLLKERSIYDIFNFKVVSTQKIIEQ